MPEGFFFNQSTIAVAHARIEARTRRFTAFAEQWISDFGDEFRPILGDLYNLVGCRYGPGLPGMDNSKRVAAAMRRMGKPEGSGEAEPSDDQLKKSIETDAARLRAEGRDIDRLAQEELVVHWRRNRPKMCRKMKKLGVRLLDMALVCLERKHEAERTYIRGGWCPGDASTEAAKECLLMGPEDDPGY
jgi:hypothetical protein